MSICTSYHCKKMQIIFTVHPSDHKKSYLAIYASVTNSSCLIAIFSSNEVMVKLGFFIFYHHLSRKSLKVGNTVLRSTISLTLTSFKKEAIWSLVELTVLPLDAQTGAVSFAQSVLQSHTGFRLLKSM